VDKVVDKPLLTRRSPCRARVSTKCPFKRQNLLCLKSRAYKVNPDRHQKFFKKIYGACLALREIACAARRQRPSYNIDIETGW
jgi:hypothetical protein